jgi:hypothetical protein
MTHRASSLASKRDSRLGIIKLMMIMDRSRRVSTTAGRSSSLHGLGPVAECKLTHDRCIERGTPCALEVSTSKSAVHTA